jgi:hypothetical protein
MICLAILAVRANGNRIFYLLGFRYLLNLRHLRDDVVPGRGFRIGFQQAGQNEIQG